MSTCTYCGSEAEAIDHIVPKSRGGTNVPENLTPACKSCNSHKKDRTPSEWLGSAIPPAVAALERKAMDACGPPTPRARSVATRVIVINFRVTAEERALFAHAAEADSRPMADWVRHEALQRARLVGG